MFSPSSQGGPATATRSRRRQRPKSTETLAQAPKAKRQRIPLIEQTLVNPEVQPEPVEAKNEKPATLSLEVKNDPSPDTKLPCARKDLKLRVNKPKHGERATHKGDGSLLLTSNNAYTVSKLPALPDRLRNDWSGPQHADVFSSFGYALTVTPTHAIVWPYNSTSQSPETFTFTLPSASKPSDGLPVGCLVSPSASSTEPGLVVVMAGTGRVVFWESISSAATFAFIKKDRSGVEYTISGISSGENVVAITNAESAGFILTFNTGRLAYMSVRDSHGRPAIAVQFLRTNLTSSAGGFGLFGSIRQAFSNLSLKGDVAAVRADRSGRVGERNIVALTGKGKLHAWRIHRGGHYEPCAESDMREPIISALRQVDPVSRQYPVESFEAVDFTFVPKGLEPRYADLTRLSNAMRSDDPLVQHLLVLVSLTQRSQSRYALVEVILTPRNCKVGMVRPITSYSTPVSQPEAGQNVSRPQLYLPRPALVAFIVFDRAAVVASVAVSPDSPDSQLQADNDTLMPLFEDVVDFRDNAMHEIVGSGFEEAAPISTTGEGNGTGRPKSKNPAAVLLVRGAGVVRIATTDVDKFASDQAPRVSAKSKLEQAVFFGTKQNNPLVFDARTEQPFSNEELARAAREVSHEILSSSTPYISTLPASLEDNLVARSMALERLVLHLAAIGADLDRITRWSLLFDAEKMHVATLLWKRQEKFVADRPAEEKKSLIGHIVEFIHQDQKHNPSPELGEVDRVRHWFVNDVFRLEIFVAWAYEVIKILYKDKRLDDSQVTTMMHEAIQVNVTTHSGALQFREDNLAFYGLGDEKLEMGIMREGYEGLPEPWTGCHYIANNLVRLVELSGGWYLRWSRGGLGDVDKSKISPGKPDPGIIEQIFDSSPVLIDSMLLSLLEYSRWAQTTADQKTTAQTFAKEFYKERYSRPIALGRRGKWEDAAKIAEKHGSLSGLAVILLDHLEELDQLLLQPKLNSFEIQNLKALRETKKAEMEDRFSRYGQDFAFPVYEYMLEKHGVEAVLEFSLERLGFKTQFLRSRPELARISWINDVQREKDVSSASQTLMHLALDREQQVWSKKIELSLGKLALLAEAEQKGEKTRRSGSPGSSRGSSPTRAEERLHDEQMKKVDKELVTVRIQDQLWEQIYPSTYDAVDETAALSLAMEAHGGRVSGRKQKALRQLFEDGMERLLKHEALDAMTLIDLLTLAELRPEAREEIAHPFWLALKVAESSCHGDEMREAKQLIWRRLYIRDDWVAINDTQQMDDAEVVNRLADTELYAMLSDCVRFRKSMMERRMTREQKEVLLLTGDVRSGFRPMPPREALGAFSEQLDRRFRDFEGGMQAKLMEAMRDEDEELGEYIEKSRLGEWSRTALEAAEAEMEVMEEDKKRYVLAEDGQGEEHMQEPELPSLDVFGEGRNIMPGGMPFDH